MSAKDDLKPFGPFRGVNNRLPDFKLRSREGDYLRHAVNADVTDAGSVRRRKGQTRIVAAADAHSFWSHGELAYYVAGGTLYALSGTVANPVSTAVLAGVGNLPMSFAAAGDDVFASNGVELYELVNRVGPAPVPTLAVQPDVSAGSGGALPAGHYQVCFTLARASGEEGAATAPVRVEVGAGGVLSIANLPAAFPGDATELRIYMTACNDTVLAYAASLLAPTPTLSIPIVPTLGSRCMTLHLRPMPAGTIVRWLNGRLYVASGRTVIYSEPWAPTLFDPSRNYIAFPNPVTVMEPCVDGMFIAADKTYWLGGDPTAAALRAVLPYGAVPGTACASERTNECFWMSARGMVRGRQDGSVENLQEAAVATEPVGAGAMLYREQDGLRQLVSSLFGSEQTVAAAGSWMDAEVVRKETVL